MSEINFEALGRCQHLKALVLELRRERDRTFNRIKHSYITPSQDTAESVHHFETGGLRTACDKLDHLNTELMTAVDEHNKWAKEANLPDIKVIKHTQIPS
ncbi:Uncharacterised protein [Serratia marcescens]|uniref:hypothetical protein n=1 Tax=Serratia marcescens TaxID=615 RepID=UPI00217A5A53|nr:hypothetical protein [Serratia marcescens]CAI1577895.1 Uncharacterised protein [Serratia marcescens]